MMFNARYLFEPAFECFDKNGVDALNAAEIDTYLKDVRSRRLSGEAAANIGRIAFLSRLVREKLRGRLRSSFEYERVE